ncbi:folate-binding protein [Chelatococcus sp. SYSU_G07232]|uniref:Folate-binding protein n=1 Tax=Chelatococcus albus TaxID=3047466 RepID=A0ABT7AEG1_9HYPH|nr:folate-binding protein [Chelatococcus sp. SYSU_G07232]MDJ1157760.1 folate-binding protein [Chelatococcus sp. SYSU_G07232]
MPAAHLADRGVVKVAGDDARHFLHNLVTSDVARLDAGAARLAALLSPQGKILFDFLVVAAPESHGGGFLLDAPLPLVGDLVKRLNFYKLRAKVIVEDLSEVLAVAAFWDMPGTPGDDFGLVFADPRLSALGQRAIGERMRIEALGTEAGPLYHARRIALGVPEGGKDFAYGDAFPHEALMDALGGVDFGKGCYVGQEVVSRMQHRGTARTRILPVVFRDGFVCEDGAEVLAGAKPAGHVGSTANGRALAMLRLDRLADAFAAGEAITAGGLALIVEKPAFAQFEVPAPAEA